MYKRILLKLSGEQLSGKQDSGLDNETIQFLAKEIKTIVDKGCQVAIVVGGGNLVRGSQIAGGGIHRVTADHMGMLATLINALAVTDIFESTGLEARCLSNLHAEQVAEMFVHRLAEKHLLKNRVVLIAGGTSRPYLTTDTAAVQLALELHCDAVLKATKVDGVYDMDPMKYSKALKHDKLSFEHAVSNAQIKVMDKAALGLAMEHSMPVVVFDGMKAGNLLKIVEGKVVGTKIG